MIDIINHTRVNPNNYGRDHTLLICGSALDDRCTTIRDLTLARINSKVLEVTFNSDTYSLGVGDKTASLRQSNSILTQEILKLDFVNVAIDITSLGFVELLVILRWFKNSDFAILGAVYGEPKSYKPRADYMSDFGHHEFDLTSHSGGFKAIPGFSKAISSGTKATLIALLGFERSRLGQLIQLDEGAYIGKVLPIFGTPSYKVGWDKHCFFQNIETIKNCCGSPNFVSSYSPYDLIETLKYIKECFPEEELMIAPFGTKPLSLGAAIFLSNNSDTTLKYDHPIKKQSSSSGVARIHLYELTQSE
ncbi:hypothetical protein [Marinobacter sp.]|uniref:hypothetical protein n=1 Tax=Marinobacter sp. TaxID=50741 RepID=UPI001B79C3BD|nr:hypothetical protein [Marinobacter sp.]MBQ0832841.1 hypothetical protein [Marinobacter sp.]